MYTCCVERVNYDHFFDSECGGGWRRFLCGTDNSSRQGELDLSGISADLDDGEEPSQKLLLLLCFRVFPPRHPQLLVPGRSAACVVSLTHTHSSSTRVTLRAGAGGSVLAGGGVSAGRGILARRGVNAALFSPGCVWYECVRRAGLVNTCVATSSTPCGRMWSRGARSWG